MSDPRDRERELEEALDGLLKTVSIVKIQFVKDLPEVADARARIVALFREAESNAVVDYLKDKDFIIGDLSGIEGAPPK